MGARQLVGFGVIGGKLIEQSLDAHEFSVTGMRQGPSTECVGIKGVKLTRANQSFQRCCFIVRLGEIIDILTNYQWIVELWKSLVEPIQIFDTAEAVPNQLYYGVHRVVQKISV